MANSAWTQYPQNGVVRPLKTRNGWADLWQKRMNAPIMPTPTRMIIPVEFNWGRMPEAEELGLPPTRKKNLQVGGECRATETLESFLRIRGCNYRKGMSSPVTSRVNCSRLSPYLAWGCISVKSSYQQLVARQREIQEAPVGSIDSRWLSSLSSFSSRLAWHCHFMQKLEDEPELEFQNISRVYDGLRENDFNQERFETAPDANGHAVTSRMCYWTRLPVSYRRTSNCVQIGSRHHFPRRFVHISCIVCDLNDRSFWGRSRWTLGRAITQVDAS